MRPAIRRMGVAAALLACAPVHVAAQDASTRRAVDHLLRSPALPAADVRVAADLADLGVLRYRTGSGADVEAFVFADTAGGRLRRVFIAHFEGYPPGTDGSFRYPRIEMTRLGAHEYLHQTWAIARFSLFEEPAMQAFLRARGLAAEPSWLVDRYVRTVDEKGRHEVIFFYLEAASLHDAAIAYGGAPVKPPPPPAPPEAVATALRARARTAFHVTDR